MPFCVWLCDPAFTHDVVTSRTYQRITDARRLARLRNLRALAEDVRAGRRLVPPVRFFYAAPAEDGGSMRAAVDTPGQLVGEEHDRDEEEQT